MAQTTNEIKLQMWIHHITKCKKSNLSVRKYCEQNNLSTKSYWYYHGKISKMLAQNLPVVLNSEVAEVLEPTKTTEDPFLELTKPQAQITPKVTPIVEIEKDGFRISVNEGFEQEDLFKVLQVIKNV